MKLYFLVGLFSSTTFGMFRLLHQMAVDALQQNIHQHYCLYYHYLVSLLSHQSLSGDPTFEGAAKRLE
jgi:hypothetical protein